METIKNIAGLSFGGGKKENFFLSLLEYYPDKKRWFLKSLHQVKDEETDDRDAIITAWITQYGLKQLVVDFPLSKPLCEESCLTTCTSAKECPREQVKLVRAEMQALLDEDSKRYSENPKKYEQDRAEIIQIEKKMSTKGYTLIPLALYFKDSRVKCEIALAKGKKLYDKRDTEAKKDVERKLRQGKYE